MQTVYKNGHILPFAETDCTSLREYYAALVKTLSWAAKEPWPNYNRAEYLRAQLVLEILLNKSK